MNREPLKIIIWGPGHVGGVALKEALQRPEFEVVGALVYNPAKNGVDLGTLAGLPEVGVAATNDLEAIIALDADCVVHTAQPQMDQSEQDETVIRMLESGKNLVSVVDYFYPRGRSKALSDRLEAACQKGGSSIMGSGIHPNFMLERIVTSLTGMCTEIDHIRLVEATDCSHMDSDIAISIVGWGKDPADVTDGSPGAIVPDRMYREAIFFLANRLFGVEPEAVTIEGDYSCIVAEEDFQAPHLMVKKGTALTITHTHKAYVDGKHFFTNEEYWYLGKEVTPLPELEGGSGYVIEIEGKPARLKFVGNADSTMDDGVPVTTYITAVPPLLSVPFVCRANPGIVYHDVRPHYKSNLLDN